MSRLPELTGCPDDATLARVVHEGAGLATDAAHLTAHLARCARCATIVEEHRALAQLGQRLPFTVPGNDRRQRVRAALLAGRSLRQGSERRLPAFVRWLLAGAGLAAAFAGAGALALYVWPGQAPAPGPALAYRAAIDAASGARFERIAGAPHEIVRLYEGTIRTTVPPATHGETVRIVTGAGEVVVKGTIFDTSARGDRLVAVKVQRGRVVVRPPAATAAGEVVLDAGRRWDAPEDPAAVEAAGAGDAVAPAVATARAPAARRSRDPAELAFGRGLALLRAADPQGAAQAFEQTIRLAPRGNLVEDASYFRAVALVRNRTGEQALRDFLGKFPRSARVGEASVMLGWRLLDRGDKKGALAAFEDGLTDPSARVRKSARAGLDAAGTR